MKAVKRALSSYFRTKSRNLTSKVTILQTLQFSNKNECFLQLKCAIPQKLRCEKKSCSFLSWMCLFCELRIFVKSFSTKKKHNTRVFCSKSCLAVSSNICNLSFNLMFYCSLWEKVVIVIINCNYKLFYLFFNWQQYNKVKTIVGQKS